MFAAVWAYGNPRPDAPTCSGWTEAVGLEIGTYNRLHVLWKRASSEGASYIFACSGALWMSVGIVAYSGCIVSGDPVDVYSSTEYVVDDTTIRASGITTTRANDLLLFVAYAAHTSATPPSGMTERVDYVNPSANYIVYVADVAQASAGASGDKDATLPSAITGKHAVLVAIKEHTITGTGAVQIGAVAVSGSGAMGWSEITGTGALTIASPALSGRVWMNSSAHRQLAGSAMLNGIRGKADLWGIKGTAEV